MEQLWSSYLEQAFPIMDINELIVYTDRHRYWLADGLLEYGSKHDWKVSVTLLDEIIDEELMEIKMSFQTLSENTLLAAIFSSFNPEINRIFSLFDPFNQPEGFQGYSLFVNHDLPDQMIVKQLSSSLYRAQDRVDKLSEVLSKGSIEVETSAGTFFSVEIDNNTLLYPFRGNRDNRHVLLPSTSLLVKVRPQSMDGTVVVDRTIGKYYQNNELIDPMGKIDQSIYILVENGYIVDIRGESSLARRLQKYVNEEEKSNLRIETLDFGLGQPTEATGVLGIDRLANNVITFSTTNNTFEFAISQISIK